MPMHLRRDKFKSPPFCHVSAVCKNQTKFQNTAFLWIAIQIWIDFYALTRQKILPSNLLLLYM